MTTLWSGCRPHCARVRGTLTEYGGLTCIFQLRPYLGFTFFIVDPETIRIEVYHANNENENIRRQQLEDRGGVLMSIKAIHTLKGKLGMSDAEYRALLMREAGVSSSRDLTPEGDKAVMAALRNIESRQQQSPSRKPAEAKIWALWYAIKPYFPEAERTTQYLLGIVSRVIGYKIKDAKYLPRLNGQEKYKVIEALKARLQQEKFLAEHR